MKNFISLGFYIFLFVSSWGLGKELSNPSLPVAITIFGGIGVLVFLLFLISSLLHIYFPKKQILGNKIISLLNGHTK